MIFDLSDEILADDKHLLVEILKNDQKKLILVGNKMDKKIHIKK